MRLPLIVSLAVCLVPLVPAQVVINEFTYDDTSTDDREFVEIFNAGPDAVDISNWTVENHDEGGMNPNPTTIPAGTMLPSCGYYVIGDTGVPNTNQFKSSGWLQNSKESILLKDASGTILDAVAYETWRSTTLAPELVEGTGIWGNFTSNDATLLTWSRWIDGRDTDDNGADFGQLPMTPGERNGNSTTPSFVQGFDSLAAETAVDGWSGSLVAPTVVDPITASASNPNPVPSASPQGGNAMVAWAPTGGGSACFLDTAPAADMTLECYVYLSTFAHNSGQQEQFSIGVCGTTGTFFSYPIGTTQNGNTGVCWTYQVDSTGVGTLELRDEASGGAETILTSITINAGVNDGWQRLRLSVTGTAVEGNFGGVYGMPGTGVVGPFTISSATIGQAYFGYREGVTGTTNAHPVMVDALDVSAVVSYQLNQPGAYLSIDCTFASVFAPAVRTTSTGASGRLDLASTAVGLPWDLAVSFESLVPAVITTGGGQLVNINVVGPVVPILWLNGATAPALTTTAFPAPSLSLIYSAGSSAGTLSTQLVTIDPTNAEGFSLSQGGELDVQ